MDTGGGVKNALPLFSSNKVLILNSDIFWSLENFIDINTLISNFKNNQKCRLLLVPKKQAYGIYKNNGDFFIENNFVKRAKKYQKIYYYSGAQMISLNVLKNYSQSNFSFNIVWDELIDNKDIFADVMKSTWYHIGDINGLKEVENLLT